MIYYTPQVYDFPAVLLAIFLFYNLFFANEPISLEDDFVKNKNKKLNVLITGAAQGIGKQLAKIMAQRNVK